MYITHKKPLKGGEKKADKQETLGHEKRHGGEFS